jgi:hypothetical protein
MFLASLQIDKKQCSALDIVSQGISAVETCTCSYLDLPLQLQGHRVRNRQVSTSGLCSHTTFRTSASSESMPPKYARPTHFLAFPITSPACQARSQEVVDILLNAKPRLDGVDESLAGSPKSLHLTLGIMSLAPSRPSPTTTIGEPYGC